MTSDELVEALKTHGSKFVYNTVLLNEDVYVLRKAYPGNAVQMYHKLKMLTSDALDVPLKNVAVVGSAKVGYSLTPEKNFRLFNDESDLDVAIVSAPLFAELWECSLNYVNSTIGGANKEPYSLVAKNVFKHFISIKTKDVQGQKVPYFASWLNRVDKFKQELELNFKLPTEINYRVYDAWKYVEQYHVSGLNAVLDHATGLGAQMGKS